MKDQQQAISNIRLAGWLLLAIFFSGILVYQILRGPIVFGDEYLTATAESSTMIISSVWVSILAGLLSILVSLLLFPIFRAYKKSFAWAYVLLCSIVFVFIVFENMATLSLLELSRYHSDIESTALNQTLGNIASAKHEWAHYLYLTMSTLPVALLYFTCFRLSNIPKWLSISGLIACIAMFIMMIFTCYSIHLSALLMIPMAIVQLIFPAWLIIYADSVYSKSMRFNTNPE